MQVHGLSEDGSYIRLERFTGGVHIQVDPDIRDTKTMVVVDVETTGLDRHKDQIIEFAAAVLKYREGEVVSHEYTYSALQDPGVPLSRVITEITGLTDQDLQGQQIPDQKVEEIFESADFIVSHNAEFDWSFCRARWPKAVDGKLWACSLSQVDWSGFGFPVAKQEVLARYHGFFYDAHRASVDVEALTKILQMRPTPKHPTYLGLLLQHNSTARYRASAWGTPFAAKDNLKSRGYHWDAEQKVWWTTVTDPEVEREWLNDLYLMFPCRGRPEVTRIDPVQQWA